jgi:hypothetical protein
LRTLAKECPPEGNPYPHSRDPCRLLLRSDFFFDFLLNPLIKERP